MGTSKQTTQNPDFRIRGTKLTEYLGNDPVVVVPDGVAVIGDGAFKNADKTVELVLPEGVRIIEGTFADGGNPFPPNLEILQLPDTLSNMPCNAVDVAWHFYDYQRLKAKLKYHQHENGLYLGNSRNPYVCLVKAVNTSITSIMVPDGCRVICGYAFENCDALESIVLPDSVVRIEDEFLNGRGYRRNFYLRRSLKMNMPKGYLQTADKLPAILTYDLMTTKWKGEVTFEDYAWVYLFQNSKNLEELAVRYLKADPNRAVCVMDAALKQHPVKAGLKKAAEFIQKHNRSIDQFVKESFLGASTASQTTAAVDLMDADSTVAETKHVTVKGSTLTVADGVSIIPNGFFDRYLTGKIQRIVLPDSVTLLDESKLPKDIDINMPSGYPRSTKAMPPKMTCDLLSRQWRSALTLTDYAHLFLYQRGKNFVSLCLYELEWDPDASVKELIHVLAGGGTAEQYQKAAKFLVKNQEYVSTETTALFMEAAKAANAEKAASLARPTLKKDKKNIWDSRKQVEIFCHDHFSNYAIDHIWSPCYGYDDSNFFKNVFYKDTGEKAAPWVVKCALAPYLELFKSLKEGITLKTLPDSDHVASEFDQKSLLQDLTDEEWRVWYHYNTVIPICRYADEETAKRIVDQIKAQRRGNCGAIYKNAAIVAAQALLLNDTETARKFAKSSKRLNEYEEIHGKTQS